MGVTVKSRGALDVFPGSPSGVSQPVSGMPLPNSRREVFSWFANEFKLRALTCLSPSPVSRKCARYLSTLESALQCYLVWNKMMSLFFGQHINIPW